MDIIIIIAAVVIVALFIKFISLITIDNKNSARSKIAYEVALNTVSKLISASVGKLEQIIASELRRQVKNGEADRSELFALADEAYREVVSSLNNRLYDALSENITDVELYIRNKIESCVLLLKKELNRESD